MINKLGFGIQISQKHHPHPFLLNSGDTQTNFCKQRNPSSFTNSGSISPFLDSTDSTVPAVKQGERIWSEHQT
jgi:hypothetical protein